MHAKHGKQASVSPLRQGRKCTDESRPAGQGSPGMLCLPSQRGDGKLTPCLVLSRGSWELNSDSPISTAVPADLCPASKMVPLGF